MFSLIKKLGIPLKDPVMDTDFIFGKTLAGGILYHQVLSQLLTLFFRHFGY